VAPIEGYENRAFLFGGRGHQGIFDVKHYRGALIDLLDGRNSQVLADLVGQYVTDFGVARGSIPAILRRVVPPVAISALLEEARSRYRAGDAATGGAS
jgi:hypothetical protein